MGNYELSDIKLEEKYLVKKKLSGPYFDFKFIWREEGRYFNLKKMNEIPFIEYNNNALYKKYYAKDVKRARSILNSFLSKSYTFYDFTKHIPKALLENLEDAYMSGGEDREFMGFYSLTSLLDIINKNLYSDSFIDGFYSMFLFYFSNEYNKGYRKNPLESHIKYDIDILRNYKSNPIVCRVYFTVKTRQELLKEKKDSLAKEQINKAFRLNTTGTVYNNASQ